MAVSYPPANSRLGKKEAAITEKYDLVTNIIHKMWTKLYMKVVMKVNNLKKRLCHTLKAAAAALLVSLIYLFICTPAAPAAQKITVTDDLGRVVTLAHPAVRVVCLSEAHAENIVALHGVGQLAGIAFATDREWVRKDLPQLSRNPSAEQILAVKPDLVVADAIWALQNGPTLAALEKAQTPLVVFSVPNWTGFARYLTSLGALTGRAREADAALDKLEKTLAQAKERSSGRVQPRVFVLTGADFSTCDPFSWGARLVTAAGAKLVTDVRAAYIKDAPWLVFYGARKFAAAAPNIDVIITVTTSSRAAAVFFKSDIMKDPRFKETPAVKNGRVFEMKEADLMPSLLRLDASLKACALMFSGK